jgi:hypothetical protein
MWRKLVEFLSVPIQAILYLWALQIWKKSRPTVPEMLSGDFQVSITWRLRGPQLIWLMNICARLWGQRQGLLIHFVTVLGGARTGAKTPPIKTLPTIQLFITQSGREGNF